MGAAAALALTAAPAAADARVGIGSASAFWTLPDAQNTRVSLQGTARFGDSDPASLFLFVTQSYCDTSADEMVFRSFFTQGTDSPRSFQVHPLLRSAFLHSSPTVTGFEQRYASCASPSTFAGSTNLEPSEIEVDVTWAGSGSSYEVQPGITGRSASATGSISGATLSLGSLGASQFAELRSQTN